jgi:FkbH-like protein
LTAEDRARADSYTARQRAESLRAEAPTLPDFWRSLEMRARIRPVDGKSLARAAQLTQKTNQFNLTLTRRSEEQLSQLLREPDTVARTLQLEDRFARHGIVGLVLAVPDEAAPEALVIDTLLLSCRVIGRTAERHLLAHVARAAATAGYERLIGTYVPGPRNSLVADLYPTLGFADVADGRWEFDLANELEPSAYIADE